MSDLHKNKNILIFSKFFSDLGGYGSLAVFPAFILFLTDNSLYVALFLVCRILGSFLAGLVASRILHSKTKAILVAADISRVIFIFIFMIIINIVNFDSATLTVLVIAFLLGFGQAIYNIGINANIPKLVAQEYITKTNVNLSVASSISVVASGLVIALGIILFGYKGGLIEVILFYVLSAIFTYVLNFKHTAVSSTEHKKHTSFVKGYAELKKHAFIIMMMMVTFIDTLASGSHNVGRPILASQINHQNLGVYASLLLSTWALGKISGSLLAKKFINKASNNKLVLLFVCGVFIMSASFITAYNIPIIIFIFLFLIVAGLGDGFAEVTFISRLQKLNEGLRVLAFSWVSMAQTIGFAIGITLSGVLLQVLPLGITVITFHSIPIISCLIFFLIIFSKTSKVDELA